MGEVFAGRYELVDPIGRGGVGAVWRAWDHRRRRYVAAKVLQQSDAHTLLRFVREQAVRIDHPHVLAPASWAADDDKVLFTMDLVAGGSLAHLIGDYGPLPAPFVCTLLDQLLSGVAAVHAEGVVHRDIKPANVLLEATGTRRPHLRLSDFGISMRKGEPRLTDINFVVGTPGYFAPEQAAGAEPDFPADLFAVGLVALYLLEGAKPDAKALVEHFTVHGTPPAPKNIPEPLWQVLAALLQPDPDSRFRTATGARKALAHAAEMLPEPGPDDEVVEVFDQIGPLPAGFGPHGPLRSAAHRPTGPGPDPAPPSVTQPPQPGSGNQVLPPPPAYGPHVPDAVPFGGSPAQGQGSASGSASGGSMDVQERRAPGSVGGVGGQQSPGPGDQPPQGAGEGAVQEGDVRLGGAEPRSVQPGSVQPEGADSRGAQSEGAQSGGAQSGGGRATDPGGRGGRTGTGGHAGHTGVGSHAGHGSRAGHGNHNDHSGHGGHSSQPCHSGHSSQPGHSGHSGQHSHPGPTEPPDPSGKNDRLDHRDQHSQSAPHASVPAPADDLRHGDLPTAPPPLTKPPTGTSAAAPATGASATPDPSAPAPTPAVPAPAPSLSSTPATDSGQVPRHQESPHQEPPHQEPGQGRPGQELRQEPPHQQPSQGHPSQADPGQGHPAQHPRPPHPRQHQHQSPVAPPHGTPPPPQAQAPSTGRPVPDPQVQDPSQAPTAPAQRETSPTRPYTSHGPYAAAQQNAHGLPLPPASQGLSGMPLPEPAPPGSVQTGSAQPGTSPAGIAHAGPLPPVAPHPPVSRSEGRAARRKARQRKPGPPRKVAIPMLLLAVVCFAVGIWALSAA